MEKAVNYILKSESSTIPQLVLFLRANDREGIARFYDELIPENRL